MGPIARRTEPCVRGSVQVAWLALDRMQQHLSRTNGVGMSTREAWQVLLKSANWVVFQSHEDQPKSETAIRHRAAHRILDALNIQPQAPKTGKATVH